MAKRCIVVGCFVCFSFSRRRFSHPHFGPLLSACQPMMGLHGLRGSEKYSPLACYRLITWAGASGEVEHTHHTA
jgi:hypothetical protein